MLDFGPRYRPAPPELKARRVYLRPPLYRDHEAWAELRAASRAFLEPWEPSWEQDALSFARFRDRLRVQAREWAEDRGYAFFLFAREDDRLLGGINLSHVRRAVSQAANLGYWMGAPHAGRGLLREALSVLLPFAFDRLGFHRIDSACIPENWPSRHLLRRMGFLEIGEAPRYLRIAGEWRDHVLHVALRETLKLD